MSYNFSESRIKQREDLLAAGINPYEGKGNRTHYISELENCNCMATIVGRIINKQSNTIWLQDISETISVDISKVDSQVRLNISIGDFVECTGKLNENIFISHNTIKILTKALRDFPDVKDWVQEPVNFYKHRGVDFCLRPDAVAFFKSRVLLMKTVREYLDSKGMIEVETPVLRSWYDLVCYDQFETIGSDQKKLYLRLCHEDKLKQLIAGGFEKVYELGKSFRPSDSSWKHSIEFTQLETIQAYTDYFDMMDHAEELYNYVTQKVLGKTKFTSPHGCEIDISQPWKRISVRDAILEYSGIDIYLDDTSEKLKVAVVAKLGIENFVDKNTESVSAHSPADPVNQSVGLPGKPYCDLFWGLVEHCIDCFVVKNLVQPTIIYDYPVDSNWLCKRKATQPNYIERFEAYIDGIEIANCYSLVNDVVDFVERLESQREEYFTPFGKKDYPLDVSLIEAKAFGLPPMSESSFGIDRWLMLICEQKSIQDVIWMPYPYV
jgi:lysyl-tRNA synthetase class 2